MSWGRGGVRRVLSRAAAGPQHQAYVLEAWPRAQREGARGGVGGEEEGVRVQVDMRPDLRPVGVEPRGECGLKRWKHPAPV